MTSPSRMKPGTRSFMRLRVRRKVDFPEPVGPISAVIDPRFRSTLMSLRTIRPEKPEVQVDGAHDAFGAGRVGIEGLQSLCRHRTARRS